MDSLLDYAVVRSVPPAVTAVALAEAKKHCNVVATDDDDLITRLIEAAVEQVEHDSNLALVTQTLTMTRRCWPAEGRIELPRSPLQSVTAVSYRDTAGNSQVWANTNYIVDTARRPGVLWLDEDSDWPTAIAQRPDAVTITYVAGYGDDAADVPQRARQAVLLLVGHWYRSREAVGTVGTAIELAYRSLIDGLKPGSY